MLMDLILYIGFIVYIGFKGNSLGKAGDNLFSNFWLEIRIIGKDFY